MNHHMLKVFVYVSLFVTLVMNTPLFAQSAATFEVGTGSLPIINTATTTTLSPFTRITFGREFAPGTTPNVFPMTPEFGAGAADDPCTIRIRNIDHTGFDAACLEPVNEDRDSPAVSFDYIAMINGTLNVPIVGSANTVRFESACNFVSTQQFGPNCSNCTLLGGQVQGFTPQSFISAFNNPPALLTQITTTNNTHPGSPGIPGGEPEFLEASVQTNSLTASDFDWTIGRMEAGNGSISNGETMCYLAVERDGCQELDFSTLGGPASVSFTAVFGNNVDGHGNGATTGEGASFPAGCFSSTPVTIGNTRSRRGNNGGFLRLASQNTSEVIFTYDEDRVSDTDRNHIDEEVSAIAFSSTFTTPVTLSRAKISQRGRRVSFEWETASETFHLGFHLWGETPSGWEQLNKRIILGAENDTAETNRYKRSIRLDRRQLNDLQRFGISTIDNTGFEEFYGPFELDTEYGEEANNENVDWTNTRKAFEQRMRDRGFVKRNNRWRKASKRAKARILDRQLGANSSVLNLEFEANGIHAVPANTILDLVPSWLGKPLSDVAITLNGEAVARDIISQDELLDSDDQIIINVSEANGRDAVYLQSYVYQVRLDRSRSQDASYFDGSIEANTNGQNLDLLNTGLVSVTATEDKVYSAGIESDTPWYDTRLLTRGAPVSKNYTIDFPQPIDIEASAILDFTIFGGIDLAGELDDHHAQVSVNGTLVDDIVFDGLNRYSNRIELPSGLLTQSNNIVSVTVVGDTGLFADLILIDEVTLSGPELLIGKAQYDFSTANLASGYQVSLADADTALIYGYTRLGSLSRVTATTNNDGLSFKTLPGLDSLRSDLRYTIAQLSDLPQPLDVELAEINLQHTDVGDLLLVAHPNFLGDDLEDYAEYKTAQGYTVTTVDWLELVQTYGYGNNTPAALDNFLALAYQVETRSTEQLNSVLIVGGHTYDYLGRLDENIVNFVPTHYRKVSIFDFTPSDNVFADLNNDQIPDLAIGRWPVRTEQDLSTIIKKSKDWQANRDASPYQDALLLSQTNDSSNLNFTKQLDIHLGIPLSRLDDFDSVTRVSMQELNDSAIDNPIQAARDEIENKLNGGLELLSFGGHGSYGSWGFQGVVNTDFVKSLSNQGKPAVVMPLACYTSNYEHPSVNTLAHQWLFAGDFGAAAIHGASVLGEYRENAVFSERYLNNSANSKTIGEAIYKAKNEMASGNQMLHNWAYLGDPTLPLR